MIRFVVPIVLLAGLWFGAQSSAAAAEAVPVTVVDGDTLEVDGRAVRLYGIDSPELGQFCLNGSKRYRCGYEAALILAKLVGNGPVECRPTPVDAEDAGQICAVELVDLAEAMLRRGYAVALPSALPIYLRAELEAKRSKLGIWRGDFIPPAEWRQGRRLEHGDDEPKQVCDIKGILSDTGERVYVVATDREYDGLVIDEARGERHFCSDDEAELAGWRRWPKSAIRQRPAGGGQP